MEVTKRDMINAKSSSEALNKLEGTATITNVFYGDKVDVDTGEVRKVMYLKTKDGNFFGTISETAMKCGEDLEDIIADEGSVDIKIVKHKSNAGREFITIIAL